MIETLDFFRASIAVFLISIGRDMASGFSTTLTTSVVSLDPNEMLVEFCLTTKEFDAGDADAARYALTHDDLEPSAPPTISVHKTAHEPIHKAA